MGPIGHSAAALVALVALPVGLVGCALSPRWRRGLHERLGATPGPGGSTAPLWIHAASVGETRAAAALLPALRERGIPLLLTHSSPGGRDVDDSALAGVTRAFGPLDHPWCVAASLSAVRPRAIVLVETEIWPIWIRAAQRRGVPVCVISGRISDAAFERYRRVRRWLAPTFGRLTAVGARTEEDAERFAVLGVPEVRVEVTGDLKLASAQAPPPLAGDLAALLGERRLWVAGSTHPGEEAAVVAAWRRLPAPAISLVLAPRRPERADEVEAELRAAGARVRRRSRLGAAALDRDEILLVDSIGELRALYARAALAFVGGTLAPVGGHNLFEPVQQGTPVLFGPRIENVRDAAAALVSCGAGGRVADASELGAVAEKWLADPVELRDRGLRGRAFLARRSGSEALSLALLEAHAGLGAPARSGS